MLFMKNQLSNFYELLTQNYVFIVKTETKRDHFVKKSIPKGVPVHYIFKVVHYVDRLK